MNNRDKIVFPTSWYALFIGDVKKNLFFNYIKFQDLNCWSCFLGENSICISKIQICYHLIADWGCLAQKDYLTNYRTKRYGKFLITQRHKSFFKLFFHSAFFLLKFSQVIDALRQSNWAVNGAFCIKIKLERK